MKRFLLSFVFTLPFSLSLSAQQSIFTTQTPVRPTETDNTAGEYGVVFTASVDGQITGVKFWKSTSDTGTHTGRLWRVSDRALLATVTFTGETASGWQTQSFGTAVNILANTQYLATVSSPRYYGYTNNGLGSVITSGNLSTVVGNNGLWGSSLGAYPTATYQHSNYFRDVVFVPGGGGATPTIAVTPATVTLNFGQQRQFSAALGGGAAGPVAWSATCGSINSSGLYTAPQSGTSCNVTGAVTGASNTAVVTLLQPPAKPTIISQTMTLSVAATGTAPLSYQWQRNGINIAGATAASYTTSANTSADSSQYSVVVTNAGGSVTGSIVAVTVTPMISPPATPSITGFSSNSGLPGDSVTIAGTNFGAVQGASTVRFDNVPAAVTGWNASSIVATVPLGTATGAVPVVVTVGGAASNAMTFTVLPVQTALPSRAQVLAAARSVDDYWIAQNPTPGDSDWARATYLTGNLAAFDATGQANYLTYAQSWASQNGYNLFAGNSNPFADPQAAGEAYIRLYQLNPAPSSITGITQSISGMVNSTVVNDWTWVDALNMSMPSFVLLGSIYNDTGYYTKMYSLYSYSKYSLGLYNPALGLWWRDGNYTGTSVYWSRGNGWAFAAHAKVLSVLPQSDPHYAEYLSTFVSMAQALATRQQPAGYWNEDLNGTGFAGPESSGTAFFLYGLAWGLNNGVLDQNTYLPVVAKAWSFFTSTAIQPSGLLGYVQPTAKAPGPGATVNHTEDYGVGAFLLAARQMALLTN